MDTNLILSELQRAWDLADAACKAAATAKDHIALAQDLLRNPPPPPPEKKPCLFYRVNQDKPLTTTSEIAKQFAAGWGGPADTRLWTQNQLRNSGYEGWNGLADYPGANLQMMLLTYGPNVRAEWSRYCWEHNVHEEDGYLHLTEDDAWHPVLAYRPGPSGLLWSGLEPGMPMAIRITSPGQDAWRWHDDPRVPPVGFNADRIRYGYPALSGMQTTDYSMNFALTPPYRGLLWTEDSNIPVWGFRDGGRWKCDKHRWSLRACKPNSLPPVWLMNPKNQHFREFAIKHCSEVAYSKLTTSTDFFDLNEDYVGGLFIDDAYLDLKYLRSRIEEYPSGFHPYWEDWASLYFEIERELRKQHPKAIVVPNCGNFTDRFRDIWEVHPRGYCDRMFDLLLWDERPSARQKSFKELLAALLSIQQEDYTVILDGTLPTTGGPIETHVTKAWAIYKELRNELPSLLFAPLFNGANNRSDHVSRVTPLLKDLA